MEEKLTEIYFGTPVEAEFIAKVLEDNNIPFLIRDIEKESRIAGWVADIIPNQSCKVFVFDKDLDTALRLMKELEKAPFDETENDE